MYSCKQQRTSSRHSEFAVIHVDHQSCSIRQHSASTKLLCCCRETLLLATYLNAGGRGAADRPRRAALQRKFRLPGEPQAPDAACATERDVAAALVEVAHAYAAAADLTDEEEVCSVTSKVCSVM